MRQSESLSLCSPADFYLKGMFGNGIAQKRVTGMGLGLEKLSFPERLYRFKLTQGNLNA